MKPVFFPERNCNIESTNKTIPAFLNPGGKGEAVLCWKLNLLERLKILFTGKIWSCTLTHHKPYRPLLLTTKKGDVLITEKVIPKATKKLRKVA